MTETKMDVCPYCQHERHFGIWTLAHWQEILDTRCEACGNKYSVRRGIAIPQPKLMKKVKP